MSGLLYAVSGREGEMLDKELVKNKQNVIL